MADIKFSCTKCGRCCQNNSLPLTLDEAILWLEEGGNLAVFCEADPWIQEPSTDDIRWVHRKRRSFEARCGLSPARVTVLLVGVVSGSCMHLRADMTCGIYERRPLVCRIYPTEISPLVEFNPALKLCPPEAWALGETIYSNGNVVGSSLRRLVETSKQIDQDEAPQKDLLCRNLKMDVAAIAGVGFVVYEPARDRLLPALKAVRTANLNTPLLPRSWRFYSRSDNETALLRGQGFEVSTTIEANAGYCYIWAQPRPA